MEIHNQSFLEIIITAITACFTFLFGHNLWLVAKEEKNETTVEVVTSDNFPVSDSTVKPERVANFSLVAASDSTPITDFEVTETSLVAVVKPGKDVCFAALELYAHPITLEAKKFAGYIKSEDADSFVAPQFVKDKTIAPQRESYAKFAKVLLESSGEKQPNDFSFSVGHRLEIIPLNNPSMLKNGEKLTVKVLFEGQPISGLRVSSGAENLNDGKYLAHVRTDEEGLATLEISGTGLLFVRTHLIRPHSEQESFDWESFWASLTFRI